MKMGLHIFFLVLVPTTFLMSQDYLEQLQHTIYGNSYWRLTRDVTESAINRRLFSDQNASGWVRVRHVRENGRTLDISVRLTTDRGWQRVVFSDFEQFVKSYGDHEGEIQFYNPNGICSSTRVSLVQSSIANYYQVPVYIADSGNNRIIELNLKMIQWFSPSNEFDCEMEFSREFTGNGASIELNYPMDIVYQQNEAGSSYLDDYLWATDDGNHRIVKIRLSDGEIVESFGEWGGAEGQFIYPTYLSLCNNTNPQLYVVDSGNGRLVKIDLSAQTTWQKAEYYHGRYLYGIHADPFGGGVWAADGMNDAVVRYDSSLKELYEYGEYGLGQYPGKLNGPKYIDGQAIIETDGSMANIVYNDLIYATEKWTSGSGQTHYRCKPQYIKGSFKYQGIWEGPGIKGDRNVAQNMPRAQQAHHSQSEWQGTRLSFKLSEPCYLTMSVYDQGLTRLIQEIGTHRLTMPGEVHTNWDGKDIFGNRYSDSIASLEIRVVSVYNSRLATIYVFPFHPFSEDEDASEFIVPATLTIFPNYPNPFNSATHIRYQIPERGKIKLLIYNLAGQPIKTLVDETQEAGYYMVDWDATNRQGMIVSSGAYFYRVVYEHNSGKEVLSQKLLFVK